MPARLITERLIALPLLHKLAAAGIAVAFIVACLVWSAHLPPQEYTSSALLFFDRAAAAKLDPGRMQTYKEQPVVLAKSILTDDLVQALCRHFGLFADSKGAEGVRFRSSLTLSDESTSSVRITWRGADRSQTMAVTNTVAVLLTSWIPGNAAQSSNAAPSVPATNVPASAVPAPQATPISAQAPTEQTPQIRQEAARARYVEAHLETVSNEETELQSQLAAADQRLAALGQEAHRLQLAIAQINADRQAAITARQPLTAQLAAEKKDLDTLRGRYTDAYPDVEAAQERIAETEKKLASIPLIHTAPDAEQSRLNSVTNEMNHLGAERSRLISDSGKKARLETYLRGQESSMLAIKPEHASTEPQPAPGKPVVSNPVPPPAPTVENSQTVDSTDADQVHPFKILERAANAQPTNNPRRLIVWLVALAGPLSGIMYLLWAVWWFRAVRNVETLERIVPGNIAYLGAIPGMNAWRHNN